MAKRTRDILKQHISRCISHLNQSGIAIASMMMIYGDAYPTEYKNCETLRDGIKYALEYAEKMQGIV